MKEDRFSIKLFFCLGFILVITIAALTTIIRERSLGNVVAGAHEFQVGIGGGVENENTDANLYPSITTPRQPAGM